MSSDVQKIRTALPQTERGFTLIELLVTMVVIAIAAGFVAAQLNWIRTTPPLETELRDLASRMELARDEAALQGRNFGIRFYPDRYVFLDLDPDSQAWVSMEGDELLGSMEFSEDTLPRLQIEDLEIELEPERVNNDDDDAELDAFGNVIENLSEPPHVLILASGEVTPFVLELESLTDAAYMRIESDYLGALTMTSER